MRRAIDIHEGDTIDEKALKALYPRGGGAQHLDASCPRPEEEERLRQRSVKQARYEPAPGSIGGLDFERI